MQNHRTGEYDAVGTARGVDIPLVVVGCDFRTASTAFRTMLLTTEEDRGGLFDSIRRMDPSAGFMALETCNRVEWVVSTENPAWIGELLEAQMLSRWARGVGQVDGLPRVSVHVGREAALHVFRLVAGMESLAEGEAEIAGQFQKGLQRALAEDTSSRILNGMGRFAGGIAKTALRLGFRSTRTRGIHVLVARFLAQVAGDAPHTSRAVVVGMGEIGRKTADLIEQTVECQVQRMNRTVSKHHEGVWQGLEQLPEALASAEFLVVASGARSPVITAAQMARRRPDLPLTIMDIGIPRQVADDVAQLEGVAYKNVDDLLDLKSQAGTDAQRATLGAEFDKQVDRFRKFCLERHMVRMLKRAQEKRFEMMGQTIDDFVTERLGEVLEGQDRARVVSAMRELVREYSNDVFDSLHSTLEEFWSKE